VLTYTTAGGNKNGGINPLVRKSIELTLSVLLLASLARGACAAPGRVSLDRDATYEENLRWQASDDKTITPARALRWLRGMRGQAVFATTSPTEFQPIVDVQNTRVRAIAAIAYKF